jgi:hypothetical protein
MKTYPRSLQRSQPSTEDGSAVMVVFLVVAILMILVVSNARTVRTLGDELRLVEKRQVGHWEGTRTNRTTRVIQAMPPVPQAEP